MDNSQQAQRKNFEENGGVGNKNLKTKILMFNNIDIFVFLYQVNK
jgi:hypothetical protein